MRYNRQAEHGNYLQDVAHFLAWLHKTRTEEPQESAPAATADVHADAPTAANAAEAEGAVAGAASA